MSPRHRSLYRKGFYVGFSPLRFAVECAYWRMVARALIDAGGNVARAATALRIQRTYLFALLRP